MILKFKDEIPSNAEEEEKSDENQSTAPERGAIVAVLNQNLIAVGDVADAFADFGRSASECLPSKFVDGQRFKRPSDVADV